jgi:hypothetical protein
VAIQKTTLALTKEQWEDWQKWDKSACKTPAQYDINTDKMIVAVDPADQDKADLMDWVVRDKMAALKRDMEMHMAGQSAIDADIQRKIAAAQMATKSGLIQKTNPVQPSSGSLTGTIVNPKPWASQPNPSTLESSRIKTNIDVFKTIANRTIIDIGLNGSNVCIAFQDGGTLSVLPTWECKLVEQSDLSLLNGQELGDIVVNPQYSIAGEMTCLLICYTRYGAAISFAVFGSSAPKFNLEYTHAP